MICLCSRLKQQLNKNVIIIPGVHLQKTPKDDKEIFFLPKHFFVLKLGVVCILSHLNHKHHPRTQNNKKNKRCSVLFCQMREKITAEFSHMFFCLLRLSSHLNYKISQSDVRLHACTYEMSTIKVNWPSFKSR